MSFNTTSNPSASFLYAQAGTDFSSLSWLEQQWSAWYMWVGNPIIATGLMSFILHEVCRYFYGSRPVLIFSLQIVYFGRCIPWIIIDRMPYFRQWKIQPVSPACFAFYGYILLPLLSQNKVPSAKEQWECTKLVLFSHFTIELPQVCFLENVRPRMH